MPEYIERDTVLNALHEIGGCDATPDTWADGYDKAIDEAYRVVSDLPAASIYTQNELKPCPFCGCSDHAVHLQKRYYPNEDYQRWEIMCENCGAEILEFVTPERAIEAWNRRSGNA